MIKYIVENKDTGEYADFAFESCFSGGSEFGSYLIHFYPDIEKAKKFETKKLAEKSLERLTIKNKDYIVKEHEWPDVEEEMKDLQRQQADEYQEFFDFFRQEHGLTLLIGEMDDILYEAEKLRIKQLKDDPFLQKSLRVVREYRSDFLASQKGE